MATNECTIELQYLKHSPNNIGIPEAYARTKIYNNNKAYIQWAALVTLKGIKNLNLREDMSHEYHQSKDVDVKHIPGIINTSNIFTNEMNDNTNFRNLRDSVMVSLQLFLKYSHNVPSHIVSSEKLLPYYSIRSEHIVPDSLELKLRIP